VPISGRQSDLKVVFGVFWAAPGDAKSDGMVAFGCGDAKSGVVPFGLDTPGRADVAVGPRTLAPSPTTRRGGATADARGGREDRAEVGERVATEAGERTTPTRARGPPSMGRRERGGASADGMGSPAAEQGKGRRGRNTRERGLLVSGILPGYSCKEGGRVEDGLLLEFPCTSTRTRSV
jgi:hypothetical protein